MLELFHLDKLVVLNHPHINLLDGVALIILDKEVLEDGNRKTLLHLHLDGSITAAVLSLLQEVYDLLTTPEVAEAKGVVDSMHNAVIKHGLRCQ